MLFCVLICNLFVLISCVGYFARYFYSEYCKTGQICVVMFILFYINLKKTITMYAFFYWFLFFLLSFTKYMVDKRWKNNLTFCFSWWSHSVDPRQSVHIKNMLLIPLEDQSRIVYSTIIPLGWFGTDHNIITVVFFIFIDGWITKPGTNNNLHLNLFTYIHLFSLVACLN